MDSLNIAQVDLLMDWINCQAIGTEERPYLLIAFRFGMDELYPILINRCYRNNDEIRIEKNGTIHWQRKGDPLPQEVLKSPIIDISTLVKLAEINEKTDD